MTSLMTATASLWMVNTDSVADEVLMAYRSCLSVEESARCERFVRGQRQRQFVIGRVLLRMALGELLNLSPRNLQLAEQSGKAPRLITPASHDGLPSFSISHSGRWVACAVSEQSTLGLDIEMKKAERDFTALAQQAFDKTALERWERIQSLSVKEQTDGFYPLWSEQEARFKLGLIGEGHCVVLPHAELSVVLCSALLLAPLSIKTVQLPVSLSDLH